MNDALGTRMKRQYEDRTRYLLPRRTYTIIRLDGRAFHTYLKDAKKPFDSRINELMVRAAKELCEDAQGAAMAYTQSDECSLLLTDFGNDRTEAWFDGNVQKICSVSASVFTQAFNGALYDTEDNSAQFDCRVFTIPDRTEVENYFIWRQKDAIRNGLLSIAQSIWSHKELQGKSQEDIKYMLDRKEVDMRQFPLWCQLGTLITKQCSDGTGPWSISVPWVWTEQREGLAALIPMYV